MLRVVVLRDLVLDREKFIAMEASVLGVAKEDDQQKKYKGLGNCRTKWLRVEDDPSVAQLQWGKCGSSNYGRVL